MKIIDFSDQKGLFCDAGRDGVRCPGALPEMPRSDYAKNIGCPCPICGSSLLTQADYDAVLRIERRVGIINFFFGWLAIFSKDSWQHIGRVTFNGTGKVRMD